MKKRLLFFIFVCFTLKGYSQEILFNSFQYSVTDVSARENQIVDINNEPCAIIKVRIGVSSLKFSANRNIEKIEDKEGEYWVWVSPGTSVLKITGPELPLTEIKLPLSVEPNNVYVLILTLVYPEKIIYRDSISSYVSFTSRPSAAEVYINDVFQGITPLKINLPQATYKFRLEKKKYLPYSGIDSMKSKISKQDIQLSLDQRSFRYFSSVQAGYLDGSAIAGFSFGRLGKTGWFGSVKFSYQSVSADVEIYTSRSSLSNQFMPLKENISDYWYETNPFGFSNTLFLSAGVNQQLAKKLFVHLGAGYAQNDSYLKLTKVPYSTTEVPGTLEWYYVVKEAYGHLFEESYKGINIDYGVTWRAGNSLLLIFDIMNSFGTSGKFGLSSYRETAFSLGIGVNF